MKTITLTILLAMVLAACSTNNEEADKTYILESMQQSQDYWNTGDLDGFMHNYWQSDSLKFIGKTGITYGWQASLDRYNRSYPNKDSQGTLTFNFIHLEAIDKDHYHQVGQYTLHRKTDTLSGHFTLLWKRIDGNLVIVIDHSS